MTVRLIRRGGPQGPGPDRGGRHDRRLPGAPGAYWVHGPDHMDNPRRDPRHLACLRGRGRDLRNAQDVSHHRADRDGRLHRRVARGQRRSPRLARRGGNRPGRRLQAAGRATVRDGGVYGLPDRPQRGHRDRLEPGNHPSAATCGPGSCSAATRNGPEASGSDPSPVRTCHDRPRLGGHAVRGLPGDRGTLPAAGGAAHPGRGAPPPGVVGCGGGDPPTARRHVQRLGPAHRGSLHDGSVRAPGRGRSHDQPGRASSGQPGRTAPACG